MDKSGTRFRWILWRLIFILAVGTGLAMGHGRPKILISNDDGIRDVGLKVLVSRLATMGEIIVAAPSVSQSGVGHGTTYQKPFAVESWTAEGVLWYSIDALPATCVRIALANLLGEAPEVVIAGINRGENVGVVTFSSGTVACAREAAFWRIPSLSVNLQRGDLMDYEGAAEFVSSLVADLLKNGLAAGTYLNVNYPALSRDKIRGVLVTRQDTRQPSERYEKVASPGGKTLYRSLWKPLIDGKPDTDTAALGSGFISVTPLQIDQTGPSETERLRIWKCIKNFAAPTKPAS
jgi:5'-nucleotidase